MTTYKILKVNGSLKSSSILSFTTMYAAIEKETEKAYQIAFTTENSLSTIKSWVPKSCIVVLENGQLEVKSWFFEKEIEYKIKNS